MHVRVVCGCRGDGNAEIERVQIAGERQRALREKVRTVKDICLKPDEDVKISIGHNEKALKNNVRKVLQSFLMISLLNS